MTPQEEEYVHFVQSIQDLNDAWRVLVELRDTKQTGLIAASAFRYAIIAYARPYTQSRGKTGKHILNSTHVPDEHSTLHADLLQGRHQLHAHSDLSIRDARVYVSEKSGKKVATQIQNKIDALQEYQHLDSIIDLVERTLEAMYEEAQKLEQALPVN